MSRPVTLVVRDRLHSKLARLVEDTELFNELYPDVPVPALSVGGIVTHPPFEINVAEIPTNVTFEMPSSCPEPTIRWTQEVAISAMGATLAVVTEALASYTDLVMQVLIEDKLMGCNVLTVKPKTLESGTSFNDAGGFIGATIVGIECTATYEREKKIWEVLRG
jgi:hypothetical protein